MPDLSMPAAVGWLAARDPAALAVARPGAVDADSEALRLLASLGDAMDRAGARPPGDILAGRPDAAARMARLLPQIGAARRLMLLDLFGPAGAAAVLSARDGGGFLRAEVAALARRGVAERALSLDRAAAMVETLKGEGAP